MRPGRSLRCCSWPWLVQRDVLAAGRRSPCPRACSGSRDRSRRSRSPTGWTLDRVAEQREHLGEPVVGAHDPHQVRHEAVAQAEGGEGQRAARVLLLGQPEQVGAVADLGLDLLLAVAEVVVGEDRDHHAVDAARGDLEGPAVVVQLVLVRPAHARRALAPRWPRLTCGRPRSFLRRRVRCGARMTQPLWPVQWSTSSAGVVLGQVGIAGVAEDALDEVEVGDQAAGHEEAHLHALLRRAPRAPPGRPAAAAAATPWSRPAPASSP